MCRKRKERKMKRSSPRIRTSIRRKRFWRVIKNEIRLSISGTRKEDWKKKKKKWKNCRSSYETDSVGLIVLVLRTNLPGAMPLHATVNFRKSDRDYRGATDNELLSRALLSPFFSPFFSSLSASQRQLNRPVNNYSFASHLLSTW